MTIDLSLLPDGGVGWLDASGQHADIVLSTRIRLARNVEGYAFTARARDGERLRVLAQVRDALGTVATLKEPVLYRLDELAPTDRAILSPNGRRRSASGPIAYAVASAAGMRFSLAPRPRSRIARARCAT